LDYVDVPAPTSAYIVQAAFSGEFVDKVITAESSGNAQARPCDAKTGKLLSSAYGAGQFVEATWLEMVKKHRPDLAARSDEDILGLRGDFALSREMTVKFAEENRTYLIKHGFDPTDAALYLAHFAGKTGAVKLLKAHRDTPVEKILSPEAVDANQFLKGQTPATLYAWARKKMNVEVSPLVKQARVSAGNKVTAHADISGCGGAKPAKDDAKAPPRTPELEAGAPETEKTRTVTAEAPQAEESRLSRAVRFVVGGVVKFATRS
jgi:hypothetical protein